MGWDLTRSCAEACSCGLMQATTLGISYDGRTRLSTAISWVARP
jgi:hypothetical protein